MQSAECLPAYLYDRSALILSGSSIRCDNESAYNCWRSVLGATAAVAPPIGLSQRYWGPKVAPKQGASLPRLILHRGISRQFTTAKLATSFVVASGHASLSSKV